MASLTTVASNSTEARQVLDGGRGHKEAVAALAALGFSTTEASVRRYRVRTNWRASVADAESPPVMTSDDVGDVDLATENLELRAANARLFKSYSKEKAKGERLIAAVYNAALDAASSTPSVKPVAAPSRDKRTVHEEAAIWHLTDWQLGKKTSTYSTEIGERRVRQCVAKYQELTEVMQKDHPVKHGVVLMTGDMLEGCNIFPAQEWELDATLFEQIFATAALEEFVVREALKTYETVDVVCEWGNHGRIGKRSDGFKPSDNVDRIIYEIVRQRFLDEPRIKNFQLSDQFYQHFTVGEYSAIAVHGDEIKSFGGNLPSYGILRKANAWASGVVEDFRDMYIGHYHQSMELSMANGGSVWMSGSTESGNEYAREFVAASNEPSQRISFVNPRKGFVTYTSRIWLT